MTKKWMIILLFLAAVFLQAQARKTLPYDNIRAYYEQLEENDPHALVYVNRYIKLAKEEGNFYELMHGYKAAVFYSANKNIKLKYADSALYSALQSKDKDLIATGYLCKGTVYYFSFRKYRLALEQYLMAHHHTETSKDEYLKYKILYHIGMMKSYLGYDHEALEHLTCCLGFFSKEKQYSENPYTHYNASKGYLNTLHQIIIIHDHLNNKIIADSLLQQGLLTTMESREFDLEKGYFLKCQGIREFQNNNLLEAISLFKESLLILKKSNDFAWIAVIHFYWGKSLEKMKDSTGAIEQYKKVDSIYQKNTFIFPDLRENYFKLIAYYEHHNNLPEEIFYRNQLQKVNESLIGDFTVLGNQIYKGYEIENLNREKKILNRNRRNILFFFSCLSSFLVMIFIGRSYQEKKLKKKYEALYLSFENSQKKREELKSKNRLSLSDPVIADLLQKLENFENSLAFCKKGLTLRKMAEQLKTNETYLSSIIHEYRGATFYRYLSDLRISYITTLLYKENKFLNYTIDALAEECGIASRQNFSDLFYETHGIRPKDFIRKRKEEIHHES